MSADLRLDLEVTSDAARAADEVRDVADAYADLAREVDRTGDIADQAGSKLDGVTDSADGLASTSSQATGALGALSSGFDLVGLEQYSGALQGASMATDFLSGVGDSLTLVLQNQKIAQIASTVASKATTAATKAQAIAQRALNLVMRANPIGLIITAVLALIAGFVLLYKRSETFRNLIKNVGDVGKRAIQAVVDVVSSLVDWVKDKIPDAFGRAKDLVVKYVGLITAPQRKLLDLIKDVAGYVKDSLPDAFDTMRDLVVNAIAAITAPFQAVIDLVQKLIDKIGNIDLGIVGDVAGAVGGILGRRTASTSYAGTGALTATAPIVNVYLSGAVGNEDQVASNLQRILTRRLVAQGYR